MRILNVNSILGLKAGGGTAERTFQMSRHLAMRKVETTVLTLDIDLDVLRKQAIAPATVVALPCVWRRFYIPLSGWRVIANLVKEADVIHLMGHWGVLNAIVYVAAKLAKKPYVVCPAGSLLLFGRSRLLKQLYNFIVGNALIRDAAAWIAVTDSEFMHFEKYGISSSSVVVIPNGVNKPDTFVINRKKFLKRHNLPDAPIILFMGRLNEIKGPDILLKAYIKAQTNISLYHLVFAGPDGGMMNSLLEQARQARMFDRIHFIGYVSGEDKLAAYYHAELLVVPSRQEAMSIVALEAGICGTPTLLTDQCGFSQIKTVDPRMEVEATVEGIASGISSLLSDEGALARISPVWKMFVEQQYSWECIVEEYIKLYKKIVSSIV